MGGRVSKTLVSEKLELNCGIMSIPQNTPVSDIDARVLQSTNAKAIVDAVVRLSLTGTTDNVDPAIAPLISTYRVMVYTLTFSHDDYKRYSPVDGDVFEDSEEVVVAFLALYKGHPRNLVVAFQELFQELKEHRKKIKKDGFPSANEEFEPLNTTTRLGERIGEQLVIYELSVTGVKRAGLGRERAETGSYFPQALDPFQGQTACLRNFTERDVNIVYTFVKTFKKLLERNKYVHIEAYTGYVADATQLCESSPSLPIHKCLTAHVNQSCQISSSKPPGTIVLLSSKHLRRCWLQSNRLPPSAKKVAIQEILNETYIGKGLETYADMHVSKGRKNKSSDVLLLEDRDKCLDARTFYPRLQVAPSKHRHKWPRQHSHCY